MNSWDIFDSHGDKNFSNPPERSSVNASLMVLLGILRIDFASGVKNRSKLGNYLKLLSMFYNGQL